MIFIDTHCHLSDRAYSGEEADYIRRAKAAGVNLLLQPDIDSSEREAMFALVDAMGDFLEILRRHKGLRGNMHAYSGSLESFQEIQRLGDWRIGVGGVVTFKNAGLAEVVRNVPLDRIVLETDAPYLTPVPHRGTRNESSYIPLIAAKIAGLKGVSVEEVAETTTNNAKTLFGI